MTTIFRRAGLFCGMLALAFGFFMPLTRGAAQDGGELNPEQIAALDRTIAAINNINRLESYMQARSQNFSQELSFIVDGEVIESSTSIESTIGELTFIRQGDEGNIRGSLVYKSEGEDRGTPSRIFVAADLRRVDGVLYINAISGEGTEVPSGWVTIADEAEAESTFSMLDLRPFLYPNGSPQDIRNTTEQLRDSTLDVVSMQEDREGVMVERISLLIDPEYFIGSPNEENASPLVPFLIENAVATITVEISPEGNLLLVILQIEVELENFDLNAADPDQFPAGSLVNYEQSSTLQVRYKEINGQYEPVTAPPPLTF